MPKLLRPVLMLVLSTSLGLLLTGCYLRFALGYVVVDSTGEAVDLIIATFDANASLAICDENAFSGFECNYYIDGVWISSTGSPAQRIWADRRAH